MKKLLSICIFTLLTTLLTAQVYKTINVPTAGTLTNILTSTEKTTITDLTVTGEIDATDIKCMKLEMTVLTNIDISAVCIKEYTGDGGTYPNSSIISYPANEMPQFSFYNGVDGKQTLTSIILPTKLTSIGDLAFASTNLNGITLPDSLNRIGYSAFKNCLNFGAKLIIPESVTSIEMGAFNNCKIKIVFCLNPIPPTITPDNFLYFPNVYVPTTTAATAYKAATGWNTLKIDAEKQVTINCITAGGLASALISNGNGPLSSITHITVTGNINDIDIAQMRTNMTALTEIDLSGVSIINNALPDFAFQTKNTLYSISLPESLNSIGEYAFEGCTALSDLHIPTAVTSIGNFAFATCSSLTGGINISNNVTELGEYAFFNCSKLNGNLTIGNSLTTIKPYTFYGCSQLSGELSIPSNITNIGDCAFTACSSLTGDLSLPNSITSLGIAAFYGCSGFNGNLTLPNNISILKNGTFEKCTGLIGKVIIPSSVSGILSNDYSFNDFYTHYFANPLGCFNGCSNISELVISKHTTLIGDNAFNGCDSLKKITTPQMIPPTIYTNTFSGVNKENCILEIPIGSSLSYQITNYWSQFIYYKEIDFELMTNSKITDIDNIRIYKSNSELIIDGTANGEIVTIYSTNGKLIYRIRSLGERIHFSFGNDTIYLIRIGEKTLKILL